MSSDYSSFEWLLQALQIFIPPLEPTEAQSPGRIQQKIEPPILESNTLMA